MGIAVGAGAETAGDCVAGGVGWLSGSSTSVTVMLTAIVASASSVFPIMSLSAVVDSQNHQVEMLGLVIQGSPGAQLTGLLVDLEVLSIMSVQQEVRQLVLFGVTGGEWIADRDPRRRVLLHFPLTVLPVGV